MAGETDAAPSLFSETAEEAAEFNSLRDGAPTEAEIVAEPKPAAESKPEAKAKSDPANDPKRPPGFVPNQALKEERERRQAVERELAELRAGKQPTAEAQSEIDPETDPIAALKEVREFQSKQRQEAEQTRQLRDFDQRVQAHERDFATATPDYGDAVSFLTNARAAQIKASATALGRTMTDAQLGDILMHEARQTSNEALQNGRNPGEVFYTLAKSFGYAGKPATDTTALAEVVADPPPAKIKESGETIDRLIKGQRAASKSGGGGEPAETGEMSLEAIGKLEGAAFDAAFAKFSASQKKAEKNIH